MSSLGGGGYRVFGGVCLCMVICCRGGVVVSVVAVLLGGTSA